MTRPFRPWKLQWTPEHVQRFWDWASGSSSLEGYFALRVGDSILDQVARYLPLAGTAVDVGCGPGHLTEKLLQRGMRVLALDISPESVAAAERRLQGRRGLLGVRLASGSTLPLQDGFADLVFLIETVEHLADDDVVAMLRETRRITRPGGHVVITTPFQEDLSRMEILCPDCGCVFHTVQHVRSVSIPWLQGRTREAGWTDVVCRSTLFSLHPRWLRPLQSLKRALAGDPMPHLLYIGRAT